MKCNVCNNKILDENKQIILKRGRICKQCFRELPKPIRDHIDEYTAGQVKYLKKTITKVDPMNTWCRTNSLIMGLGDDYIYLKGYKIPISEVKAFRFVFHPVAEGKKPNVSIGRITAEITLKKRGVLLSCEFSDKMVEAVYRITKNNIIYFLPVDAEFLEKTITEALRNGQDFVEAKKAALKSKEKWDQKKAQAEKAKREEAEAAARRAKEKAERDRKAQQSREEKARREEEQRRRERQQQEQRRRQSSKSPLDNAKDLFHVEMPFTKEQIKTIRNELLKKHHPDAGGSLEKCQEINTAYDLLLKFAN